MSEASELDEVVKEFLVESYENLDQLDRDLVALEQDPHSKETLGSVFRTIHTIKGTCGFLGFSRLEGVTHVGENLLTKLRDGRLVLNFEITTALLALVDAVRQMLSSIEGDGSDGENDYSDLVARLDALYREMSPAAEPANGPAALARESTVTLAEAEAADGAESVEVRPDGGIECAPAAVVPANGHALSADADGARECLASDLVAAPFLAAEPVAIPESPEAIAARFFPEPDAPVATQDLASVAAAAAPSAAAADAGEARASALSDSTIRVDVHLLDRLMNLVGELVLARNQILQLRASAESGTFAATTQRLNLITTELQEGVMKTRMQPIGNLWSKFPRVVRDLGVACNKRARIELEGRDTELDKTIIEAIKDPLTHLVRNAMDHGIESPDARRAAGKPIEGRIFLHAFHEGGQVNIEISDDGGGIDPERLKEKALAKGLITSEQAARLGEREAFNLIFLPGFSTAAQVTNVSGRGVGMDVVKTNIERIGGVVDVQSQLGQGTTFKMKIPLTLAIIPALIVSSGGQRYAIPQVSLLELVRLDGEAAVKGIETIQGAPVYRLRGNLLPIVHLSQIFARGSASFEAPRSALNIVVLQADDRRFGLVVEGINDTEEIVVKPLGRQLKSIASLAGATIMGDGRVALILDVLGLAQSAGLISEVRTQAVAEQAATAAGEKRAGEGETMLVLGLGTTGRVALPLSLVDRLEEIPVKSVELSAHREVVQYRNELLPLLRIGEALGYETGEAMNGTLQVVVCSRDGRRVGLVVDQILDIVEDPIEVEGSLSSQRGLRGTAVIRGRVTDLLDVPELVEASAPGLFDGAAAA
jgi:two-component system, chemotaxis family, sensor kinase CheA